MKEFKIDQYDYQFRVKKMNAIQFLALRSQINFDNYEATTKFYEVLLNNIEVEFNGQWLPVREEIKNQVNYYPAGIEDNIDAVRALINYFMGEVLKPIFTKSNASK